MLRIIEVEESRFFDEQGRVQFYNYWYELEDIEYVCNTHQQGHWLAYQVDKINGFIDVANTK